MKKSMNRDFPLSPTPAGSEVSFSGPIKPAARVNSDSLMRQSIEKKNIAKSIEKVAKAQIKKDGGNKPESWDTGYTGPDGRPVRVVSGTTGNRKMQRVAELRQSASADSLMAVRSKVKPKK
jgi:hypothetical protein